MKLDELKTTEVDALNRDTVVLVPVAAIEQHGPHLPVGTDSMIAQGIGDALDSTMDNKLLVTPVLKFGCSEHHMSRAGTVTLAHEQFKEVVIKIIDSLHRHGFKRFIILNAHGGNMAVSGVIGEKAISLWPDSEVLVTSWFRLAADAIREFVEGEGLTVGHACEFETSLMLHLHPALVDMSKAVDDGIVPDAEQLRGDLLVGPKAGLAKPFHEITKHGVIGKATLATAEKGRRVLVATVGEYVKLIRAVWK
jgi:creatinine amidohydrolase